MKTMIGIMCLILTLAGCKKILDEKSTQWLVIPASVNELQAIMDNSWFTWNTVGEAESSVDNLYILDDDYDALEDVGKGLYTWARKDLIDDGNNGWQRAYGNIFYANTAIEGLNRFVPSAGDMNGWRNVMGQALFQRGRFFYMVATVFALQYDPATAAGLPGIPLRMNSNYNEVSVRSTLEETYQQILKDVRDAVRLLPARQSFVTRPSRAAAYGLLARVYQVMNRHAEAGLYADSSLQLHNALLDFNTVDASAEFPIQQYNPEVIFTSVLSLSNIGLPPLARVVSNLYDQFADNDLRKAVYFGEYADGSHYFKGTYDQNGGGFDGLATDEMLLIRAESHARSGDADDAMGDLNALLEKRWVAGTFTPLTAPDAATALAIILVERRKELINRGLRWTDVKRLNAEGAGIVMKRLVQGVEYILPPNDLRYALPIPDNIILLTGMQQNPR